MTQKLEHLKAQLRYQQGKVQYTRESAGRTGTPKELYHLEKIAYIEGRIKEMEAEG